MQYDRLRLVVAMAPAGWIAGEWDDFGNICRNLLTTVGTHANFRREGDGRSCGEICDEVRDDVNADHITTNGVQDDGSFRSIIRIPQYAPLPIVRRSNPARCGSVHPGGSARVSATDQIAIICATHTDMVEQADIMRTGGTELL
jgi:hypothetical protein